MSMFILDPFRIAAPGAPPGDWGMVTPLAAETPSAFLILSRGGFSSINGTKDVDWDGVVDSDGWSFTPTAAEIVVPADGYVVSSIQMWRLGSSGGSSGGPIRLLKNGTAVAFRSHGSQFFNSHNLRVGLYLESGDVLKWTLEQNSAKNDYYFRLSMELY